MFPFLASLVGCQKDSPKRRLMNEAVGSQVESCEQRMYLTGGVMFGPAFDGVIVQPPVKDFDPATPPAPAAASFTGEWKHFITRMTLEQTGDKVKGQLTSFGIAGAKLKGAVEGNELTAVVRGKGSHPTLGIGRFRTELNLTLNAGSILSGTSHPVFKGVDLGVHNEAYTRVL